LQSKTETRHEVIGSELKKATYNLLLRNKWTLAPRKSPREVRIYLVVIVAYSCPECDLLILLNTHLLL